jgi:4-hydroxy-3-methylbut-2-en-1-yl diphosphate synthase IspG/GcpE
MQIIAIESLAEHVEIVVDRLIAVAGPRYGWKKDTKNNLKKLIRKLKKAGKKVRINIGWTGSYQSTVVSEGRVFSEIENRPADWEGFMSYATRGRLGY